jgi:hypothetical protein
MRLFGFSVVAPGLLALTSALCQAQAPSLPLMQLAEVSASDGAPGDYFGVSTAVSGNTLVVGSNNTDASAGAAYVFVQPSSGWANALQTAKLTASDGKTGDGFGWSVSISGNTIVVGAPGHNTGNRLQGAAYVFVKPSTGWQDMTETAELTALDGSEQDAFGVSVAISGNTIAIGSTGNNNYLGAAYVYLKPVAGWKTTSHFQAKLTDSDDPAGELGIAVALIDNTIVAGAYNDNGAPGAAYVFVRPPGGWTSTTQTAKLTASGGASVDSFGLSVAISGSTVLIGARNAPSNGVTVGAAYIFAEPATGWIDANETAKLTASDAGAYSGFGFSVAIDGNTAAVGAAWAAIGQNQLQGASYVFVRPTAGWQSTSRFSSKLTALGGTTSSLFGTAASISGSTIAIGSYGANALEGSAYLFGK